MKIESPKKNQSHGSGEFEIQDLREHGENVIIEKRVLAFHPENICLGDNVYIGHYTILKGYYKNQMNIDNHSWIGQQCFIHSAGGLEIGKAVGIGPKVTILTSRHTKENKNKPVYFTSLEFEKVTLRDGCDIGASTVILPGVTIGEGAIVGAGSVVNKDIPPYEVWAGSPARKIKAR